MRLVPVTLVLAALTTAACTVATDHSTVLTAGVPIGQLRGYKAISSDVKSRLFAASSSSVEISSILAFGTAIQEFMGSFFAGSDEYVNGTANSVNTMLWDLTMTRIADSTSAICGRPASQGDAITLPAATVRPEIATAIRSLCVSADDAAAEPALDTLWAELLMFDAPDEEAAIWKAHVLETRAAYPTPQAWVRGALRTALMSPYFLLNQ